ncbi:MAG: adenylate kinase, partial [Leuconostoc gelidum]
RLEVNKAANLPLVNYYKKAGILHTIDGGRELTEVYHDVRNVLDSL